MHQSLSVCGAQVDGLAAPNFAGAHFRRCLLLVSSDLRSAAGGGLGAGKVNLCPASFVNSMWQSLRIGTVMFPADILPTIVYLLCGMYTRPRIQSGY